ncbi:MFS transporter [Paraburkholderia sp. D1E]|uniref:MFS transporter n=1 Tax=Paraburkholderia sp. D1E TaxID=3461398 RepID=UPI004045D72F
MKRTHKVARSPVYEVLKNHRTRLLLSIGTTSVIFGGYYLFTTICLAFIAAQRLTPSAGLYGTIIGSAVALPIILCAGRLSDRIGRRPLYMIASIGMGTWSMIAFALINTGSLFWTIVAISVGLALWAIAYGVQGAFLPELFPPEIRYTAASLAYQVTGAIGGLLPLAAAYLMKSSGGHLAVSCMILATALLTLVSAFFCPETSRIDEIQER